MFKSKKVRSIEVPSTLSEKNYITLLKKSCNVVYEGGLLASKYFYFYKILNEAGINEFKKKFGLTRKWLIWRFRLGTRTPTH